MGDYRKWSLSKLSEWYVHLQHAFSVSMRLLHHGDQAAMHRVWPLLCTFSNTRVYYSTEFAA
jgi:hypothetical protein